MNARSIFSGRKYRHPLIAIATMLLLPLLLTGCARPGDTDMSQMLNEVFECKWVEVTDFKKTDSLPGLWSYVAQYSFQFKFKDGEDGARNFYKGLFAVMPKNEKDIRIAMQSPQVQQYMKTECSEAAQSVLTQFTGDILNQLDDKKSNARLPVAAPMSGWAEFVTSKKGWSMEVRREKIVGDLVYSEPMKWEQLFPKAAPSGRKRP